MSERLPKPDPSHRRLILALTMVLGALLTFLVQDWAARREFTALSATASEALDLQDETLNGVLEKYRLLPAVLASRSDIRSLVAQMPSPLRDKEARSIATETMGFTGALDIAFSDFSGKLVATASNIITAQILALPRIRNAVSERRLGRADITLSDGTRTYLFASGINAPNGRTATVAVLVALDEIEAAWSLSRNPIFVTDAAERVFLANRADWVDKIWTAPQPGPDLLSRYETDAPGQVIGPEDVPYVEAARAMPLLGWTLHTLVDARPIATARLTAGLIAALACAIAGLVVWDAVRRREAAIAQQRRDRALALRLERRVRDRTAELSHEVDERVQAESRLRATQNELVHAAKLATIGQMSAALSHEYNQPLGAIRTYAENATAFLERGQPEKAGDALGRISGLVDRMTALSRSLLSFSRKPGTELSDFPLAAVVEEALMLVRRKAEQAGVDITVDIEPGLGVHSGRTRLAQVFVNIIANAIDAMRGSDADAPAGSRVRVEARSVMAGSGEPRVEIIISDNGPGIPQEVADKIFTPFFTTKETGKGLGLGLAIVENIVRDLLGTISLDMQRAEGACFRITLPLATQPTAAHDALAKNASGGVSDAA